ncbi:MAG: hypothetical protein JW958_11775 [Candidatus Eisenbacteria bacterium]|nr:hypothetical protein [Candidatus Eisenbacteria bacterium]
MVAPWEKSIGEAARLRWAKEILKGSSLATEFPDVDCGIPRMVEVRAGGAAGAAEELAPIRSPLRVTLGGGERILPNRDEDRGALPARLTEAIEALRGEGDVDPAEQALVREIAGSDRGGRFYPNLSGVLRSENVYPISYMKPEEGIAYVRLGLGVGNRASMDALRFSPAHPDLMPDFSTPEDILRNSQRKFAAVDLSGGVEAAAPGGSARFDLEAAYRDGALAPVGGIYSRENRMVYPGVHREGIRLVTFAPMLRGGAFPLAKLMRALLDLFGAAAPEPLAIEFAVDLRDPRKGERHRFIVEGIGPLDEDAGGGTTETIEGDAAAADVLCSSTATLGHGLFTGLRDILCVCPDRFDVSRSHEIACEVGERNDRLAREERPYVLIGSGRWGTTDRWLGIPVSWEQVSRARVQVEAGLEDFNVESSRGTHFFRELTFHGIGAMHISLRKPGDRIDWDWLQSASTEWEGAFVRHITLAEPLRVRIDGRAGRGIIRRPSAG